MARSAPETQGSFGWKSFLGYLSSFCVMVLGVGLLAGATLGMKPLEAKAASAMGGGPPKVTIAWPRIEGAPPESTWLPKADQETLTALVLDAAGDNPAPFSPAPLARISNALDASGWFARPPRVSRTTGGSILIEGDWRIPAAVVRWNSKDYLLSWEAMPMPAAYEPDAARLPVILGSPAGPPTTPDGARDLRTPWSGEGIGAALELIQTVLTQPWAKQVRGVDLSSYGTDGVLKLVTVEGSRVVWGGRPSKPRMGEVTTAQKLVHLAQIDHDHKRIDAGYPLIFINTQRIQFDTTASAADAQAQGRPVPQPPTP